MGQETITYGGRNICKNSGKIINDQKLSARKRNEKEERLQNGTKNRNQVYP